MFHPAHLNGCSVVVLSKDRRGFQVVERGVLSFDGETLSIGYGESHRIFSDFERDSLMPVVADCYITDSQGFDFFVLKVTST